MLLDNFEQHHESFVVNTQNASESARNQINRLNTSKNEHFPCFPGFRICSMAKTENPETTEINRKLSKSKAPSVNAVPLLENC